MKVLILFSLITLPHCLYAQEDEFETESLPVASPPTPSTKASTVPHLKQGEKLQKEQHKALEELDAE